MTEHAAAPAPAPSLTVVLITPDRYDTIAQTIEHLARQTAVARLELLVVAPSATALGEPPAALARLPRWRVVEAGDIAATGRVRALAVREARAPIVVFAEDHCFPEPTWAAALLAAHAAPHAAVGPVLRNANPGTAVSW